MPASRGIAVLTGSNFYLLDQWLSSTDYELWGGLLYGKIFWSHPTHPQPSPKFIYINIKLSYAFHCRPIYTLTQILQ